MMFQSYGDGYRLCLGQGGVIDKVVVEGLPEVGRVIPNIPADHVPDRGALVQSVDQVKEGGSLLEHDIERLG